MSIEQPLPKCADCGKLLVSPKHGGCVCKCKPPKEPQPSQGSTNELLKPTNISSSQGAGAEEYKQKLVEGCWRNPTRFACLALYEAGYAAGRASKDARMVELESKLRAAKLALEYYADLNNGDDNGDRALDALKEIGE